jgi:hypothetical protein
MTTTPERTATLTTLVAAEIRAWMGRLDVRQSELARRLGETDQWMSMRLKGRTPIDLNELQRVATALGLSVLDLMPAGASRVSGATGGGPTQTIVPVESPVRHRTPVRPVRASSHVATRPGPLGQGGRRDATRPVSAVPANLRRPAPARPTTRPMPR